MARLKEEKREHIHLRVKPETHREIKRRITKGDRSRNTRGKIVDEAVELTKP